MEGGVESRHLQQVGERHLAAFDDHEGLRVVQRRQLAVAIDDLLHVLIDGHGAHVLGATMSDAMTHRFHFFQIFKRGVLPHQGTQDGIHGVLGVLGLHGRGDGATEILANELGVGRANALYHAGGHHFLGHVGSCAGGRAGLDELVLHRARARVKDEDLHRPTSRLYWASRARMISFSLLVSTGLVRYPMGSTPKGSSRKFS